MSASSPPLSKRYILAATPTCFMGFDPWVAYHGFQSAGIRYVEVLAFPAAMGIKFGLTTFAPESMNAQDVRLLRERFHGMQLTPLTVGAFCDPLDPPPGGSLPAPHRFRPAVRCVLCDGGCFP